MPMNSSLLVEGVSVTGNGGAMIGTFLGVFLAVSAHTSFQKFWSFGRVLKARCARFKGNDLHNRQRGGMTTRNDDDTPYAGLPPIPFNRILDYTVRNTYSPAMSYLALSTSSQISLQSTEIVGQEIRGESQQQR